MLLPNYLQHRRLSTVTRFWCCPCCGKTMLFAFARPPALEWVHNCAGCGIGQFSYWAGPMERMAKEVLRLTLRPRPPGSLLCFRDAWLSLHGPPPTPRKSQTQEPHQARPPPRPGQRRRTPRNWTGRNFHHYKETT